MFVKNAAVAVALLVGLSLASQASAADVKSHEGTVVAAAEGKLVMKDNAGVEHSHVVGPDTKITIDGKDSKLTELKKDDKVTVTMDGTKVIEISKGKKPK